MAKILHGAETIGSGTNNEKTIYLWELVDRSYIVGRFAENRLSVLTEVEVFPPHHFTEALEELLTRAPNATGCGERNEDLFYTAYRNEHGIRVDTSGGYRIETPEGKIWNN